MGMFKLTCSNKPMKEITFLKRNATKWKEIENFLEHAYVKNPDKLADLFVELTDDLSYSRTFYPQSQTTDYLNDLAIQIHQEIYKNKRERSRNIISFFRFEVPLLYWKHRWVMLFVFLFTLLSACIAVLSQMYDPDFANLILGPDYVAMTRMNIARGDPMGVYAGGSAFWGFAGITVNNIKVACMAAAGGFFVSVGSLFIIFRNGIMLGSFYYLFQEYGGIEEWWSFVWLHGTLEIWAIVCGGAAGVVIGNSILFPKSYSRWESFKKGSREGIRMLLGVFPLFIVAGFIEGYITRLSEMPVSFNYLIIGASLLFIVWYFIFYPRKLSKKGITLDEA